MRLVSGLVLGTGAAYALLWAWGRRQHARMAVAGGRTWLLWRRQRALRTGGAIFLGLALLGGYYTMRTVYGFQMAQYNAKKAQATSTASSTAQDPDIVGAGLPGVDMVDKSAAASPSESPSTTPGTSSTGSSSSSTQDPGQTLSPQVIAARELGGQFVTRWARPTLPAAQWQAGVQPFATVEYKVSLASVVPSRVPAKKVTGPPVAVAVAPSMATATQVEVQTPTDAGVMHVTLVSEAGSWKVSSILPASAVDSED